MTLNDLGQKKIKKIKNQGSKKLAFLYELSFYS